MCFLWMEGGAGLMRLGELDCVGWSSIFSWMQTGWLYLEFIMQYLNICLPFIYKFEWIIILLDIRAG
jgi:hypothetical protein